MTGEEMAAVLAALDQLSRTSGEPAPEVPAAVSAWRRSGRSYAAYDAPATDGFWRSRS